jgi:hypothetical protein
MKGGVNKVNKLISVFVLGILFMGIATAYSTTTSVLNAKPTSYNAVVKTDVNRVDAKNSEEMAAVIPEEVHQTAVSKTFESDRVIKKYSKKADKLNNFDKRVAEKDNVKKPKNTSDKISVVSYAIFNAISNNTNSTEKKLCKGDVNVDSRVNNLDIDPFVALLRARLSDDKMIADDGLMIWLGDFNDDGIVDFKDIDPFVETLFGKREIVCKEI